MFYTMTMAGFVLAGILLGCFLGFLTFCPGVKRQDDCLVASTSWLTLLLTLGVIYRWMQIDVRRRKISVYRRSFWVFVRSWEVSFDEIESITYGYIEMGRETTLQDGSIWDCYQVGLRLFLDPRFIHLFSFLGPGGYSRDSNLLDDFELFDTSHADLVGSQGGRSLEFAEMLSMVTGRRITPS